MPNTTKTLLKEHQDISFIKKFATKLYNDNEKYKAEYSKNKTGTRSRNDIVFSSVVFVWSLYLQQFGRNASSQKINLATVHSILLEEFHGDSHRWKNF